MGRNYALVYGWNAIRKDAFTMSFGFGFGARGESQTLGAVGTAMQQERQCFADGTSALIVIQETGLFGLFLLAAFLVWVVIAIVKAIRQHPASEATQLRYALLLFSILWPLWFWYAGVLTFRVPMLLYWATLGYVLSVFQRQRVDAMRLADGFEHEQQG